MALPDPEYKVAMKQGVFVQRSASVTFCDPKLTALCVFAKCFHCRFIVCFRIPFMVMNVHS